MRIRLVSILTAIVLLAAPATAPAQDGNPFDGSLPPAQPTPAPTAEPVNDPNEGFGRETLWIIGAGVLVALVGVGFWISRDAGGALPRDDRHRQRDQGPHRHERQAKAKARAKTRAQRQARKAGRKARR